VTSGVASEPVTITAVPLTLAPFTTSDPCMIGPGSSPINITPAVTGGVPPYTFSIVPGPVGSGAYDVPGLPPGVMLNSSTGVISGSPTSSTDFSSTQFDFTVQVEDSTGATATANGVIVLDVCTPGR